jgi:hypothetical protein
MPTLSIAGAATILYLNNVKAGFVTGFDFRATNNRRAVGELDSITPAELIPGNTAVNGTVTCMRIRLDGGLEGRGIAPSERNLLLEKYISILLVDRLTDSVIFRCDNAAVVDQNWSIRSKGLLEGSFSFIGISWLNESEN